MENIQEMVARDANILKMDIEKYLGIDSETYIKGISHSFIIDMLSKDLQRYDSFEKVKLVEQLSNYIAEVEGNVITRVKIYVDDDRLIFADERNFFPASTIENTQWYRDLIDGGNEIQWSTPYYPDYFVTQQKVITARYLLRDPKNYTKPICIISVDISEKGLRDLLESRSTAGKYYLTIIDQESQIISTSNNDVNFSDNFFSDNTTATKWNIEENGKEKYMVFSSPIDRTPWKLLYIVNQDTILEPIVQTRNFIIILSCVIINFVIIMSAILSRSMTKRITVLRNAVMNVTDGNIKGIDIEVDDYDDEITHLQTSFSKMIKHLENLLYEKVQMAVSLKNAEMKVLQAQINPHFLYNTLDIISWRAIRQKNYDIYNLVKNLAKYYKLSLNHGKEIVPLSDELSHVKYYVYIQNERLHNKITLNMDIDESLFNISIPKLTLQPIVENCITHGLMEKEMPGGNITIDSRENEESTFIYITDDGVGILPDRLKSIFKEDSENTSGSFGLNNVRYRLRLSVGGDLKIDSEPGKGTKVTLILPKHNIE